MRRRFFVDQFAGGRAFMAGETAHHLGRVLRAEPGQLYELSDGSRVWLARIEELKRDRVEFSLRRAAKNPWLPLPPSVPSGGRRSFGKLPNNPAGCASRN